MHKLDFQSKMIGREDELSELKIYLDRALDSQGSTVFVSGEAGVGKTRLVNELKQIAQSKGFQILSGNSMYESLTPFMPIIEALRSGGLDYLFTEEAPRIEAVYLVTHGGLLIKEVMRQETELRTDIFASMLTAVENFVKDSLSILSGEEKEGTLNTLGYENYRILIENGKSANLVVLLTGKENEFLISDIKEINLKVERNYENVLKDWDGDERKVNGIEKIFEPLITSGKYDGIYYGKEDPKVRRSLLFENVSLGLMRYAQGSPTILCIEDLQWADPSTLALIHYIARNTKKSNLLILGTYRPEDVTVADDGRIHQLIEAIQLMSHEDLYYKIELGRLKEIHIGDMLNSLLGETNFTDKFKKQIYKETEGNPFFIISLIRLLLEENTIQKKNDVWVLTKDLEEVTVPSKVYDVIVRRLYRLKEKKREVLEYASVIGEEFTTDILAQVSHLTKIDLLKQLRDLEQSHRLIRFIDPKYKFDHAKIKEVLYRQIPSELRKEYHALIAETIEKLKKDDIEDVIGDLAYHYSRCKNRHKALFYLIKAAENAKKNYSNEEAIRFYNQALEIEEDERNRREIYEALGDIYDLIGDYGRSIESYENALGLTEGNRKMAEIRVKIGNIYWRKGEYNESQKICNEAIALVRGEQCKEEALALEIIGIIHWRRGEYDIALDRLKKGLEIYIEINDQEGVASSLDNINEVYGRFGDYDKALEHYNKSLEMMENIGNHLGIANCLGNIGYWYFLRGEYRRALVNYDKSLKIREKIGEQQGIAESLNNIGQAYRGKEEHDKALEHLEKSMEICEKIGLTWTLGDVLNEIGQVYLHLGEYDKALEHLKKSLRISDKIGLQSITAWNCCNLSEIYLKKRDMKRSLDFCVRALDLSKEMRYKWPLGASKRTFGMIYREQKKWKESIENFEESVKIFKETGMKKELGDTYYEFGLMWKDKGDAKKTKTYLNKAFDSFEKLKLEKPLAKVKAALEYL